MSHTETKKSWWQTLPAILSAIAAVLGSLAVLIPVIQSNSQAMGQPVDDQEQGGAVESADLSTTLLPAEASVLATASTDRAIGTQLATAKSALVLPVADTLPKPTPPESTPPEPTPPEPTPPEPTLPEPTLPEPALSESTLPDPTELEPIVQRPGDVKLRVTTRDGTPNEVVIAFTNTDPLELVRVADLEGHILQKFTFSGRSGRYLKTYEERLTTPDTAFLGARYVVIYNEGGNGWDGWVQLAVGPNIVLDQRITEDLKNFRRPEMSSHRFWWKELNGGG